MRKRELELDVRSTTACQRGAAAAVLSEERFVVHVIAAVDRARHCVNQRIGKGIAGGGRAGIGSSPPPNASATTRSRPPKGRSGWARTSRHRGSGLGCIDAVRPSGFGAAPGGCVPRSHLCPATRIPAAAKTRELRSTERRVIDQKLATPDNAPPRPPDRHCATAVFPLTILCFRGAHPPLRHSRPTAPAKMAPRVAGRGI